MLSAEANKQIAEFNGKPGHECHHKHKSQGTDEVFFHSIGLLRCVRCWGWQVIREPI